MTTRQAVYDLVTRRRLLGLPRTGKGMAFPAFQFDPATGRPFAAVPRLLDAFAKAGVDSYTVATWLATPQDDLDGRSPMSLLGDPGASDALLVAAHRTACSSALTSLTRRSPEPPIAAQNSSGGPDGHGARRNAGAPER